METACRLIQIVWKKNGHKKKFNFTDSTVNLLNSDVFFDFCLFILNLVTGWVGKGYWGNLKDQSHSLRIEPAMPFECNEL